jgi:hypothetical protein
MTETKERRYIERKTLPRTVVYFRRNSRFNLMNAFRGPARLVDISKSAVCLEGDLPFPKNTDLQLKICKPDNSVFFLKGRVSVNNSDMHRCIVQILPFGKGNAYNDFYTKTKLEILLAEDPDYSSFIAPSDNYNLTAIFSSIIRVLTPL